ncbi:hypothetical protein [Tenacibaculum sp. 190524A02b]|uniref:Lipoprotein n=1 Tax=Tenacibaculum vairaonense TaxID=3137860 RepID=A0ABM9PP91_9FLAO
MKKLLLAIALVSVNVVLTSCTDNTEEHEKLIQEINAIDKSDADTRDNDNPGEENDED